MKDTSKKNKVLSASVEGNILTIQLEVNPKLAYPSSTGKSEILVTTGGYVPLFSGQRLSVTVLK